MEKNILAISGKPGLFLLVSRGRTTLIVETLDSDKKRHAVGMRDQISSLNDISIYTNDGDIPLMKLSSPKFLRNTAAMRLTCSPRK